MARFRGMKALNFHTFPVLFKQKFRTEHSSLKSLRLRRAFSTQAGAVHWVDISQHSWQTFRILIVDTTPLAY